MCAQVPCIGCMCKFLHSLPGQVDVLGCHAAADPSPCAPHQVWATYSPVKNSVADARAKAAEGNPTHSATVAEMDLYKCNAVMLRDMAGENFLHACCEWVVGRNRRGG